ncbi:MAG: nucleoside triphosphate pyrophosphohydrolase, partial [bacterium]|nr:nucleoside triphosphate pyrophosphohydrolase [bacterium]
SRKLKDKGRNMEVYNKLVRDKIPEIIAQDGQKANVRILTNEEYKRELLKKLIEEAEESSGTKGNRKDLTKEIGDLLEVIDYLVVAFGLDRGEIEKLKANRKESRGGFDRRIFLESVE